MTSSTLLGRTAARLRAAGLFPLAVAACLLFLTILGAAGQGASEPESHRDRRVLYERAGHERTGLPVSAGLAVDPRGPDSRWELRAPDGVVPASFCELGRHGDGRTGFLLAEFLDPGTPELVLREYFEGEAGAPAGRPTPGAAGEGELGPPPGLEARLVGAQGTRIEVALEPRTRTLRPGGVVVDELAAVFRDDTGGPLLQVEAFVTRWPFAPELALAEVVLRNDFLDDAHGPVRFADLVLAAGGREWPRMAVAWERAGESRVLPPRDTGGVAEARLFGRAEREGLWLGDRQGKAWRVLLGRRGMGYGEWKRAVAWLEQPTILVPEPAEAAATSWYGPITGMPWAFRPAEPYSTRHLDRLRWSWEEGWSGSRGDWKFSNSTGSARVAPLQEATLRLVQSGDRRFFDWLLETAYAQALRPLFRDFRAADHPGVWLWDGRPRQRGDSDLLGRDAPRELPEEWRVERDFEWLEEWHGWNGFDYEHLTVELVRETSFACRQHATTREEQAAELSRIRNLSERALRLGAAAGSPCSLPPPAVSGSCPICRREMALYDLRIVRRERGGTPDNPGGNPPPSRGCCTPCM